MSSVRELSLLPWLAWCSSETVVCWSTLSELVDQHDTLPLGYALDSEGLIAGLAQQLEGMPSR